MKRHMDVYKSNEVSTASKMKLVILMYDGAIRFLKECKNRIRHKDISGRGIYIGKAQNVIGELQESLNIEKGGEVAKHLAMLYSYIIANLTSANIHGDESKLDEALKVMESLREAWHTVMVNPVEENGRAVGQQTQGVAIHL